MPAAGTMLGPYRITARLGSGGMGEVFRAHDSRLDRDVAIKVISASLARDPERIRRFEQEARAAGALNHPNVCTILDIGSQDGSPFVVMELLEGETLREQMSGGPLPVSRAVEYAGQAALGLAAAHEKGIVHRDLKPENLFITRDGRLKILDFGLVKLTRPDAAAPAGDQTASLALTEAGTILGTAGYIAPEQVRGEAVDHRADLFALGAILYEMLAGRRAFQGATLVEALHAILKEEAPPLSATRRDIPPGLEAAVRHCLEKSPAERFQSARDLAFDLRAILTAPGGLHAGAPTVRVVPRKHLFWTAVGSASLLVVVIAAALWWRGRAAGPAGTLNAKRIVVAVFENQTGDASLDPLGRMTSDWITQGLSRVDGLEVVSSTSVLLAQPAGTAPARRGRDPIRALAGETGAGTVVSGSYYLQGGTLQFQARITDPARRRLLNALDPVSGPRDAPMEAVDALRQEVLGALASSLEAVHEMGIQQRPPRYDAYREFIAGFEVFMSDDREALRHFARAAELDPSFLLPLFYEAFIRDERGDHARVEEILRTLAAKREQLSPTGRAWLGAMMAYATHHYAEALQHVRAGDKLAPHDPMITLWMGFMARYCNRPQEAVDAFARFGPRPWPGHKLGTTWMYHLCTAWHTLGQHQLEMEEAHRARVLYPDQLDLYTLEARALAALGRSDEVNRVIDESLAQASAGASAGDVMLQSAAELRVHGHRAASLALAGRAVRWYRDRLEREPDEPNWQSGLLDALRWAEKWDEAYAVCRPLAEKAPENPGFRGVQGRLAARLGRRDEAARISEDLARATGPYLFGAQTYQRACIAALLGDRDRAVELLRQSLAEGVPFGVNIHREIDLEPLWDHPPFQELLRPKG